MKSLTNMSSGSPAPLPLTSVFVTAPSEGSRNGFFDMLLLLLGKGKFGDVASTLRGEGEAALNRLRKGLLVPKLRLSPGPLAGEAERSGCMQVEVSVGCLGVAAGIGAT